MGRGHGVGERAVVAAMAVALGGCPLLVGLDGDFHEVQPDGAAEAAAADGAPSITSRAAAGITAGARHSCAWFEDGAAACWGNNGGGRLGDGTVETRAVPVAVAGLPGRVEALAAGGVHTCALLAGGAVACWGTNDEGQLGDGTRTSSVRPVAVDGVSGAVAVSAGATHACALIGSGAVRCWGSGSVVNDAPPVDAGVPLRLRSLASGPAHACVAGVNTVFCWGDGPGVGRGEHRRQLSGPTDEDPDAPTVFASPGVLAAGGAHSCATFESVPFCWGSNTHGELGDGTEDERETVEDPVVFGDAPATALAAGASHTCVLRAPGRLLCFGSNAAGQLGPAEPIVLSGDGGPGRPAGWGGTGAAAADVAAVAAGGDHTCALTKDGSVWCWGEGADGQLGDGAQAGRRTPERVTF